MICLELTLVKVLAGPEMALDSHRCETEETKPDSITESGFRFVYSHPLEQ